MTNLYISSARVLVMAFAKDTGKILIRCMIPKRRFDWSNMFTLDITCGGRLAEVMRDNLTIFQEISFCLLSEHNNLMQGRVFDIKNMTFGEHKGLQRTVRLLYTDSETGWWIGKKEAREIERDILATIRSNKYNPNELFHNDARVVNTDDEAMDWLYSKYDISPNVIGETMWEKSDAEEPMYDVCSPNRC
jgi:hypothetical protein